MNILYFSNYCFVLFLYYYHKHIPSYLYFFKRILYENSFQFDILIFIIFYIVVNYLILYIIYFYKIKLQKKIIDLFLGLVGFIVTFYYYSKDLFQTRISWDILYYIWENIYFFIKDSILLFYGDYTYFFLFLIFLFILFLNKYSFIYKIYKYLYITVLWIIHIFLFILIILYFFNIDLHFIKNKDIIASQDQKKKYKIPEADWFKVEMYPHKNHFYHRYGFKINNGNKPNIVIFLLESVRKDSIHLENSRFFNLNNNLNLHIPYFFVPIPHSSNTHFTLLTGYYSPRKVHKYYKKTHTIDWSKWIKKNSLINELKKHNYQTIYLTSNDTTFENEKAFLTLMEIETIEKKNLKHYNLKEFEWGIDDFSLFLKTKEILPNIQNPFFILYVFSNSHTPYYNPLPQKFNQHNNKDRKGRYLNTINYTLDVIDKIMELYQKLNLYKNTIFFLLSDHGESFGEKGYLLHDFSLYNTEVLVPFIVHSYYFQYIFDKNEYNIGSLIDVVPTILDLINIKNIQYKLPGRSIFDPEYSVKLFLYPWGDTLRLGVISKNIKYILHFDKKIIEILNWEDKEIQTIPMLDNLNFLENWEPFSDMIENILR